MLYDHFGIDVVVAPTIRCLTAAWLQCIVILVCCCLAHNKNEQNRNHESRLVDGCTPSIERARVSMLLSSYMCFSIGAHVFVQQQQSFMKGNPFVNSKYTCKLSIIYIHWSSLSFRDPFYPLMITRNVITQPSESHSFHFNLLFFSLSSLHRFCCY